MELKPIEKELNRALVSLGSKDYGSDDAEAVIRQATKLAEIYKTVSSADVEAAKVEDAHDKEKDDFELRKSIENRKMALEESRFETDKSKLDMEKTKIEFDKDRAERADHVENRKIELEERRLKMESANDLARKELDTQRLKLDEKKIDRDSEASFLDRAQRSKEARFGFCKDTGIALLQIGTGVATTAIGVIFGREVLKFEETGTVCSIVGKSIIPKILGKIK